MLRLIVLAVFFYVLYSIVKSVLISGDKTAQVRGNPKKRQSLDLKDHDVEDADFHEVEGSDNDE